VRGRAEPLLAALAAAALLTGCGAQQQATAGPMGAPVRVQIPAVGVDARVIELGLRPDGRLEVPGDPGEAGWWRGGPRPGQRGPAVIAGHVDDRTGPAVFASLRSLHRGDEVWVADRAGRRVRFVVQALEEHPKDRFPTQRVYGATGDAALRLITCTGRFDNAAGHYDDNLVVFATRA